MSISLIRLVRILPKVEVKYEPNKVILKLKKGSEAGSQVSSCCGEDLPLLCFAVKFAGLAYLFRSWR